MSHLGELRARVATTEKLNYKYPVQKAYVNISCTFRSDSENFRFNTGLKGTNKKFYRAELI